MLILLSPAKALDVTSELPKTAGSTPRLLDDTAELAALMAQKSVADLAQLSGISDELAALNAGRWAEFTLPAPADAARPAVLMFAGDVYQGMAPRARFDTRDYTEAQKTLRILSGLYGLLRPLDLIQPYRLEMGTRLANARGANLYEFWGDRITTLLREDLAVSPGSHAVLNLASKEYADAVRPDELDAPMISPRFEDTDAQGRRRVISFFAKRARGELAAWLIQNRVRTPRALPDFDSAGYRYHQASSTPEQPVFVRAFADR